MSADRAAWPTAAPDDFPTHPMNQAVHFPDPMVFHDGGIVGGTRIFRLSRIFRYRGSLGTVTVPAGFATDGASIPRIFWPLLDPYGPWFPAAIIHDWLYSPENRTFARREADLIFKEAMFHLELDWPRREAIFRAVRIFGGRAFRGSRP